MQTNASSTSLCVTAKSEDLVSIRRFVEDVVTALDIDSTIVADVVLAVDEAISTSSFTATRASLGLLGSK